MMPALNSPIIALPLGPQSVLKAYQPQIPVTFEILLDIAATTVIVPPAAAPETALSLPIKIPIQDEKPDGSLVANISFLPAPICTDAVVDDNLHAEDFSLVLDEQETITVTASTPAPFLPLPFDLKYTLPILLEPQAQNHPANEPDTAIQSTLNPKAMLPVVDVTVTANTQQPNSISSNVFAVNTQQLFADRQLDCARDHLWLDHLASDIVAARQATDKVSFRLLPPRLGQLDVEILASDTGLMVNLTATTQEAAKIVSAAQPRLIDELIAQGMRVNSAEISHREMPQHGDRQSNSGAPQTAEFDISDNTETTGDEAERPAGRFA